MDTDKGVVVQSIVSSTKWSVLVTILPRLASSLAAIVLARFLFPEDYGVVSVSLVIIALSQILQEVGLGQAYVQLEDSSDESKNAVFYLGAALGLIFSVTVFLLSDPLGRWFAIPELATVLRTHCWQMMIIGMGTSHMAILKKQFEYRLLFRLSLVPSLTPVFVAIPLAYLGFGYWALIAGSLSGAVLLVVFLWLASSWKPSRKLTWPIVKRVFSFGCFVTVEGLCSWFLTKVDKVFLGLFVSAHPLGLYTFGANFASLIAQVGSMPFVSDAMFSGFCRSSTQRSKLLDLLKRNLEMFALVLFPICFGSAVVAPILVPIVFGEKWNGLGFVLSLLVLSPGVFHVVTPMSMALKAVGRPGVLSKLYVFYAIAAAPVFFLCAKHGFETFVVGRFVLEIVYFFPTVYVVSRSLDVDMKSLLLPFLIPLASAVGMAVVVYSYIETFVIRPSVSAAAVAIVLGVASYCLFVLSMRRDLMKSFFELGFNAIWVR